MKKKSINIILITLGPIISGYFLGLFLPIKYLQPNILNKGLDIKDLYIIIISIVGTIATLLAVIVALFKEEIRKIWDKADLSVCFRDTDVLFEVKDPATRDSEPKAIRYVTVIKIENKGGLVAKSCEIFLESLQYKVSSNLPFQDIPCEGEHLNWQNNSNNPISIPATGKAYVTIIEIISPNLQSVPNEQAVNVASKPKIKIGGIEQLNSGSENTVTWIAVFKIYSENSKPIEFPIEISWDHKWENRLSEMKQHIPIMKKDKSKKNGKN